MLLPAKNKICSQYTNHIVAIDVYCSLKYQYILTCKQVYSNLNYDKVIEKSFTAVMTLQVVSHVTKKLNQDDVVEMPSPFFFPHLQCFVLHGERQFCVQNGRM